MAGNASVGLVKLLDEMALSELAKLENFRLVERRSMEAVLLEQELALSDLMDASHAIRVGNLLAANYIVTGTVIEMASSVVIFGRIINVETGASYFCNAGDNIVNIYSGKERKMIQKTLPETAAAGVFPSMLLETKGGFVTVPIRLASGDTLLLYTDGAFEDQRIIRDSDYSALSWQDVANKGWDLSSDKSGEATEANAFEELGEQRLGELQNAVFNRRTFKLAKYQNPNPDEELTFDFSTCKGTVEEAVLAMISVDKVFRVYADPSATEEDTINMDRRVDAFLEQHFVQYGLFFSHRVDKDPDSPYVSFGYLKEDSQYDDLTILGIRML